MWSFRSVKMWLTLNIYERGCRDAISMLILRLAIVEATLFRIDWVEVINRIFSQHGVPFVPLVVSLGLCIAAAAHGYCTAFYWWTRGIHWHKGSPRSIWWRMEGIVSFIALQSYIIYQNQQPSVNTTELIQEPQVSMSELQWNGNILTNILELKETKLTLDI